MTVPPTLSYLPPKPINSPLLYWFLNQTHNFRFSFVTHFIWPGPINFVSIGLNLYEPRGVTGGYLVVGTHFLFLNLSVTISSSVGSRAPWAPPLPRPKYLQTYSCEDSVKASIHGCCEFPIPKAVSDSEDGFHSPCSNIPTFTFSGTWVLQEVMF